MTDSPRDRHLQNILDSERTMRQHVEQDARDLRAVLSELACRLDGARLEQERARDPHAPGNWTAEAWRTYFAAVVQSSVTAWQRPNDLAQRLAAQEKELAEARAEIARLQAQPPLVAAQIALPAAPPAPEAKAEPAAPVELSPTRQISWPKAWPPVPMRLMPKLIEGGLPVDDPKRWRRLQMILWMIARYGIAIRMEIMDLLSAQEGLESRAGSLQTLFNLLQEADLIEQQVFALPFGVGGKTAFALAKLSAQGRSLCQAFGWSVTETDWERMQRLHQGDTQVAHMICVLNFSYQARLRGYRVTLLPPVPEELPLRPDVLVEKDTERRYVEVELSADKEKHVTKWRNLAALQAEVGVAVCAHTVERRMQLVSECRLERLRGVATDLETLSKTQRARGALWLEDW